MTVKVKVIGADKLRRTFAALSEHVTADVRHAVLEGAEAVRDEAVRSMAGEPKSGRVYTTAGTGVTHQASAPGQPPAVDTGRLVANIEARPGGNGLSATVGVHDLTNVEYAAHLEFGTRSMAARPWLFPALDKNRAKMRGRIEAAVAQALKDAGRKR